MSLLAEIAKEAAGSVIGGAILAGVAYLYRGNIRTYLENVVEAGNKAKEKIEEHKEDNETGGTTERGDR